MQISSANRPCDRNTYFLNSKYHTKKKVTYLSELKKFRRFTDPLVSLLNQYFGTCIFHVLTVKNCVLHCAAEFLCE